VPASDFPPKQVTLLLSDRSGAVLGALPPFEVEVPWWQEVGDVVAGAREHHGVDVTVLRLLEAVTGWGTAGGAVTYLAEVESAPDVDLTAWSGPDPTVDHPLRLPYARPGGPAADLAWADDALASAGRERTAPAEQVRTWNLSSIWRLPTADGPAWLKVVPQFFAHEGAMLQRLDPRVVPSLIAADGPRVLMADAPGEDHWGAELHVLERLVTMLVGLQAEWVDRLDELEQVGAPDWRVAAFVPAARRVVEVNVEQLEAAEVETLHRLVDGLPDRFTAIAECGIPDTFVHGDFHPGNAHGSPDPDGRSVLLDWGDVGIGNPLLDQAATINSIREEQRAPLRAHWARLWREAVPGCDPDHAGELLGPVRGFRQAMIYQLFLDTIEPDERVYHSGDPALWLRRAAELSG
jgi:hypothetical protein